MLMSAKCKLKLESQASDLVPRRPSALALLLLLLEDVACRRALGLSFFLKLVAVQFLVALRIFELLCAGGASNVGLKAQVQGESLAVREAALYSSEVPIGSPFRSCIRTRNDLELQVALGRFNGVSPLVVDARRFMTGSVSRSVTATHLHIFGRLCPQTLSSLCA